MLRRRHHMSIILILPACYEMAHHAGVSVEGELGVLGSLETGGVNRKTGMVLRASCPRTSY